MRAISHPSISRPKAILVATDLTDLDFLLPVAIEQARATGAMLWLLHVVPPEVYLSTENGVFPSLQQKAFREAEAALARVAFELKTMNVASAYQVRRWYPVDRIREFIREHHIHRLIIGTASRGKLGKLMVGSVAEELIRSLDIPVCTIGPHFKNLPRGTPRRIIFATSLRRDLERSFQFAADLAAIEAAELTILHVMEQAYGDEGVNLRIISKIDEMRKSAQQMEFVPSVRIRYGETAEEIVAECMSLKPELLVLGSVPASALAANFRTGVAYRVIANAPCPIFTLRSEPRKTHGTEDHKVAAAQSSS